MNNKLFIVVNVDWFFLSHRKDIALAAQANGWDTTIVTADTGKIKDIEALGLKTINLPMSRSGMNPIQEFKTLCWLIHLYKQERPAVVHHVGMKTILWGTIATKIVGNIGVVNAISGLGGFFAEENKSILSRIMPHFLRWSHNQSNLRCIFQNKEDQKLFLENRIIEEKQCRFIKGSGINLQEYNYTPEPLSGPIVIILTARMIEEKGIFLLTEAANRLRKKYENSVQFRLIGGIDDHPGAITKEQLEKVCDGKYICWLGYRTDVKQLLQACHIVAFPSYYMEGLPKSLIEAAAIGRPIITSNSVGCKDTVIDGKSGFLIEPKDIDALTEKLDILISDAQLRQNMGQAGRAYAEQYFDIQNVVQTHLSIYHEFKK